MKNKRIFRWEIAGFIFLVCFGSFLHFIFEWSDNSALVGMIGAVNESVWEHLKLGFWSLILFSLLEFRYIRNETHNFLVAKAMGVLSLQSFILVFFYSYTAITGGPILLLDILSYIIGCLICQIVSYKIMIKPRLKPAMNRLGLTLLTLHAYLLITFTFDPPKLSMFQDSHSSTYGIEWKERR